MAVKFGVFVPQGWKMDLVAIKDPVEQVGKEPAMEKFPHDIKTLRVNLQPDIAQ